MAVANMSELPDLDSLLNAGESQSCSIHPPLHENGTFDPNEFAGVVKWYHEQSKTLQLHYEQHLEHQKRKLAKENEDSLLEALQQTLQNFESDHVISDFANLSSALGRDGELDKPCMLKEILLSPFSDRYSREVNSPEHVNKDIIEYGNSSPCPPDQRGSNIIKPKSTKRLSHFSELRKHMEASSTGSQKERSQNASKLGRTRLVSSRQYISKYGSASVTDQHQVTMTAEAVEAAPKRVVVHPVSIAGKGGNKRQTLTLALKSSTAAKILDGKSKVVIQNTSSSPAKAVGVASIATGTAGSVAPASVKRSHSSGDQIPPKKMCLNTSSGDHDYCTDQSISNPIENLQTIHTGTDDFGATEKPSQKVVKWHEYLRQCREGVRSAPNSPSSSPRVTKGSGRQSNNFMVVSLHNGHNMPPKVLVNSTAGKDKSQTVMPLPLPLKKNTVKTQFELQEFDKYMTDLKDNLNSPRVTQSSSETEIQSNEIPSGKPISASQSLAAIAEEHKKTYMDNGKGNGVKKPHMNLSRSSSDGSNSSTVTSKDKHVTKTGLVSGRSGQFLMIKVPVSSSAKSLKTPHCSSVVTSAGLTVTHTTTACMPESHFTKMTDPRKAVNKQQTIGKPNDKKDGSPSVSKIPKSPARVHSTTSKDSSSPTFKLMSCNKDGEGRSLILSGVSGTLKNILTKLAELQAKSKAEGKCKGLDNDEQQITILQNLISCMASNKTETQTEAKSNHKPAQDTIITSSPHSSLIKGLITTSTTESNVMQRCTGTQLSESEKNPANGIYGINNVTPNDSQANNCDVSSVQYIHTPPMLADQSFKSNVTDAETPAGIMKTAVCSNMGNSLYDIASLKADQTNDILATAMSNVCNDGVYLLDGSENLLTLEGENIATKSSVNDLGQSINDIAANDNGPAVITLEDALMELNNEDEITNSTSQSGDINFQSDDGFFCKLPSYYMNGKVMKGEPQEDLEMLMNQGMKQESCDPLISVENEDSVGYNKLPHYFSSGKSSRDHSTLTDEVSSKKRDKAKDFAVKLNPVGEGQHLTPQGAPVDTSQTYYSRLPSYYSYGRPHPPVKTFNDEAADAKDDTVTPETLESDSRHEKRKRKKKLKKRKKKKKSKRDDNIIVDEVSEKILYSKLPSYYMSSKVVKQPGKNGRLHSPTRSSGTRSPSPYSPYCSRSSRSRSRSYSSSPSRGRRYRSRSYSRSPYSSDSDSESRRSWRRERPSARSGRETDRRSCKSTDEELEGFRRHRDREVQKTKRQHRVKQEKDNQQAMEERRVVYVGGIEEKMTKQELRNKFLKFGNIETVSLFFRNDRDNYGFLTFQYTCDAFRAIEQGADLAPVGSKYDLCFGGRRQFCRSRYEDLDSKVPRAKAGDADDFDALLQRAKRGLRH